MSSLADQAEALADSLEFAVIVGPDCGDIAARILRALAAENRALAEVAAASRFLYSVRQALPDYSITTNQAVERWEAAVEAYDAYRQAVP